jgi:hypothetical protein
MSLDQADSLPLVFMAHFQEARVQEMQTFVEFPDNSDYEYHRCTSNNPTISGEIDRLREQCAQLQHEIDTFVIEAFGAPPAVAESYLRELELYDNCEEVSKYTQAVREIEDLEVQIQYMKSENERWRSFVSPAKTKNS